jgi:dTDP-4-dehydrorhamnose reductase
MRILVLGAGGQVGRAVTQAAPTGHTVLTRTRAELDIADEAALTQYLSDSPVDWIVNGAAYTAVDRAESERASAQAINDTAVGVLARAAAARSGRRRAAAGSCCAPPGCTTPRAGTSCSRCCA